MASFFQKLFGGASAAPAVTSLSALGTDMHSHLLPGLDDGAETVEQSVELMRNLHALGYRKLVMTPHIMGDFYRNTPVGIREKLALVRTAAAENGIDLELDCAAEYYLDESLVRKLEQGEELLSFGGASRYVLFETSYINEPFNLTDIVFALKSAGYQPVLAHPERYTYLYGKFDELPRIREQGVLLQLNLNSLVGYYSPAAKRTAEKLIDAGLVDMVGTDMHHLKHHDALQRVLHSEYLPKLLALPLLNSSL
ncbi:capsular biosynthesis protein [Hymenobacter busanensis]|uniref:protein-tyrosine-phosphatase n=1 Tax=Hymenobacter busanensis TaxID=2607656 RepID=A0A7L5A0J2_9BACT|nr:CpsB/CapC family capsule biosynthesis tyrosine phosphatase [Hymenobacter busanensis]KAA9331646.1 capsular biosynthesis protein [Hymenobacter busanensis]QHJ08797.1 capsular biosynthesis protein [Hymenobacter busanensis]